MVVVKINKLAYILQVGLVFAAWLLLPVQQASQISSVWLTEPPQFNQAELPKQVANNHKHLAPSFSPQHKFNQKQKTSQLGAFDSIQNNKYLTYNNDEKHRGQQASSIVLKTNHIKQPNEDNNYSMAPRTPTNQHQKRGPDFSSTLAGVKGVHRFVDPQASSFQPAIAELDEKSEYQLKNRNDDTQDDKNDSTLGEPETDNNTHEQRYDSIKRFGQFNANNSSQTNYTKYNTNNNPNLVGQYYSANTFEPQINQASSLSPFESAHGLYGNGGNGNQSSMNEHIHFDEEQHQQLTNWAQKTNNRDHNNNQTDDDNSRQNQNKSIMDRQRNYASTNMNQTSNGSFGDDSDLETTTKMPIPRSDAYNNNELYISNYDNNYNNRSSQQQQTDYQTKPASVLDMETPSRGHHQMQANNDQLQTMPPTLASLSQSAIDERQQQNMLNLGLEAYQLTNESPKQVAQQRFQQAVVPVRILRANSKPVNNDGKSLLRFSPADQSSWPLALNQQVNSGYATTTTTTLIPSLASMPTATTDRPPPSPPLIYFSSDGDKWNYPARSQNAPFKRLVQNYRRLPGDNRKLNSESVDNLDETDEQNRDSFYNQVEGDQRRRKEQTPPTIVHHHHHNVDNNANNNARQVANFAMSKYNQYQNAIDDARPLTTSKRYDYIYQNNDDNNDDSMLVPNNRRANSRRNERITREDIALMKARQLQLQRLSRQKALLLQLKRNQQLANLHRYQYSFGPNRIRPVNSFREGLYPDGIHYSTLSGDSIAKNLNNRRWFLGTLGQKLSLPSLMGSGNAANSIGPRDYATIIEQADDAKSNLESYFYNNNNNNNHQGENNGGASSKALRGGVASLSDFRSLPSGQQVALVRPHSSLYQASYPAVFHGYGQASDMQPILRTIRQPTIPRAPTSGMYHRGDRYLASSSFDQASYLDSSNSNFNGDNQQLAMLENTKGTGPAFIPVVAVTVTKTSPAPKMPPNEAPTMTNSDDSPGSSSDLDEYIEKKTRLYNQEQEQQKRHNRYKSQHHEDERYRGSNSTQNSDQSQRHNVASGHSIGVRSPHTNDHYMPSTSNQRNQHHQQQLTTIKSAVFGYLPSQLQELPLNPLLGNILNPTGQQSINNIQQQQQQPAQASHQFYQPAAPNDATALPLALQLQANTLVQNDIVHPFGGPALSPEMVEHQHPASIRNHQHQHVPMLGHASSSPYIHYATPLTPAQAPGSVEANSELQQPQASGAIAFPFGSNTNQAAGQQLIAFAASELNPLAATFMMPGNRAGSGSTPDLLAANPQWFYDSIGLDASGQPNHLDQHSSGSSPDTTRSSLIPGQQNTNNQAPSSKGKKRSGEFFASAGQLLLSALPLLLAPTLGLMFASMPPVLPTVARHTNIPSFQAQQTAGNVGSSLSQALQSGMPGTYLNSLATGSSGGGQITSTGGTGSPHMFTPSPPVYSAPSNNYQQPAHYNPKVPKPTKYPNQHRGTTSSNLNNRFLNATGINLDSLMNGPNRPAAIVITTSTTSSPQYHNNNNNNSSSNSSPSSLNLNYHDHQGGNGSSYGTTTTTSQTIAAVDNLNVVSNQTVVFIPTSSDSSSNASHTNFSDELNPYYGPTNNVSELYNGGEPELMTPGGSMLPMSTHLSGQQLPDSSALSHSSTANDNPLVSHSQNPEPTKMMIQPSMNQQDQQQQNQQLTGGGELVLKRHHHYELIPSSSPATSSAISYIDGADFDTQYASLPNYSGLNVLSRQETSTNQTGLPEVADKQQQQHSAPPAPIHSSRDEITMNITLSTSNKDNDNNLSATDNAKLYPVTSWPSLRRKTISLVTSRGNKTFPDASDRYKDQVAATNIANSLVASDFNVEQADVTKRSNSRIFKRKRSKRETPIRTESEPITSLMTTTSPVRITHESVEPLEQNESRDIRLIGTLISANDSIHDGLINNDNDQPSLADLEEARRLRNEMLDKKLLYDRVASSSRNYHLSDDMIVHNNDDEPKKQQLSAGARGKAQLIQLPVPNQSIKLNNNQRKQVKAAPRTDLMLDVATGSHRQSMGDIVGELMLKNQSDFLAQNALDAEVFEDTDTTEAKGSKVDAEVVRSGYLNPHLNQALAQLKTNYNPNGDRRRSAEFSRQVKYSNQVGGPSLSNQGSAANQRGEADFGLINRRDHSSDIHHNINQQQQQQWGLRDPDVGSRSALLLPSTNLTAKLASSVQMNQISINNQLKPMQDYESGFVSHNNQRSRRTQPQLAQQQIPENGASTLSPYSANDFRPSVNLPSANYGSQQQQSPQQVDAEYFNYQNHNIQQRPYLANGPPNHNYNYSSSQHNNSMGFRSGLGYSGRNYYPQPNASRDIYQPIQSPPPAAGSISQASLIANYNNNSPPNHNYATNHNNHYPQAYSGYPPPINHNGKHPDDTNMPPYQHSADYQRAYSQAPIYQNPAGRARYDQAPSAPNTYQYQNQHNYHNNYNHQPPVSASDYYRVPVPPPDQSYDAMSMPPPGLPTAAGHHSHQQPIGSMTNQPPPPTRSIGPYGLMDDRASGGAFGGQQTGHYASGSMLAHQAGPLASLAANNSNDSGTVNEYLKQVHFSDSDRDKLMASYLTCDGLLNDNDHCLERLSCEFSDPLNIEKANKLDRAVSSILLGHILINTYIPNNFKHRLKAASLYGYKHSGKCNRFVCNKLIKQQSSSSASSSSAPSSSSSSSDDDSSQSSSID